LFFIFVDLINFSNQQTARQMVCGAFTLERYLIVTLPNRIRLCTLTDNARDSNRTINRDWLRTI